MNDAAVDLEQIAAAGGFLAVECCGKRVGFVNPRAFTREAAARFETFRLSYVSAEDPFGNGWIDNSAAHALIADPSAHAAPDDGERIPFTCPRCGSSFVWIAGAPQRVPKEVA